MLCFLKRYFCLFLNHFCYFFLQFYWLYCSLAVNYWIPNRQMSQWFMTSNTYPNHCVCQGLYANKNCLVYIVWFGECFSYWQWKKKVGECIFKKALLVKYFCEENLLAVFSSIWKVYVAIIAKYKGTCVLLWLKLQIVMEWMCHNT